MGSKVRLEIESFKPRRLVLEKDIKEGITLKNLLNELATTHREVVETAFDLQNQELTGEVMIILSGGLIQSPNGLETKLSDDDVLLSLQVLAGG